MEAREDATALKVACVCKSMQKDTTAFHGSASNEVAGRPKEKTMKEGSMAAPSLARLDTNKATGPASRLSPSNGRGSKHCATSPDSATEVAWSAGSAACSPSSTRAWKACWMPCLTPGLVCHMTLKARTRASSTAYAGSGFLGPHVSSASPLDATEEVPGVRSSLNLEPIALSSGCGTGVEEAA
eukprot:5883394-Alexandrium_andersonii.AAC.1